MTDDRTPNLNLPLPNKDNKLQEDVGRLREAYQTIDAAWPSKADLVAGKIPAEQLPSYVDDVLEFASLAAFPNPGETGKIYVALDTEKTYRWTGTVYSILNDFQLTPATATKLGGIKVGQGLAVDADGVVSTDSLPFSGLTEVPTRAEEHNINLAHGAGSMAITYDGNNRVSTVTENHSGENEVTTMTYNSDGTIKTAQTVYRGLTRIETYTYADGKLSGFNATEVQA